MKKTTFEELNISVNMRKAITDLKFTETTPIQAEAIPVLLEGRDIIGQARTGTGKTAAFAIPIIERIDLTNKNLQALVICPTRELAIQVTEEFRKLFKYYYGISVATVYGGQEIGRQFAALLRKPQIVVGTPGRLLDHMSRRTIQLDTVKFVVLDEADEMLNMGFRNDMEKIISRTPKARQTAMFSATMNKDIMKLMLNYQNNPVRIDTTDHQLSIPKIDQIYCDMQETDKHETLKSIIDQNDIKVALVFSNTKSRVDRIVRKLNNEGYSAAGIHGGHDQRRRERAMNSFRNGEVGILVATDVAGRGIDINDIDAVINYDLPRDDEDYTHRIGRTGRAGKCGKTFTFVVGDQFHDLMRIKKAGGLRIERMSIPRPIARPAHFDTTRPVQNEVARPIHNTTARPFHHSDTARPIHSSSRPTYSNSNRPIHSDSNRPIHADTTRHTMHTDSARPAQTTSRPVQATTSRPVHTTTPSYSRPRTNGTVTPQREQQSGHSFRSRY